MFPVQTNLTFDRCPTINYQFLIANQYKNQIIQKLMEKPLLQTSSLSQLLSSSTQHNPQKYFYCGYLFSKFSLTLSQDLSTVLSILDRLNSLFITTKQKNNILQKLSTHEVQSFTTESIQNTIFEYVDEVVPHLQLAVELERTRKESQNLTETDTQKNRNKENSQEGQCSICLQPIITSERVALDCSHQFHRLCASKTFQLKIDSNTLPLLCPEDECRKQVSSANITECLSKPYQQKHESFLFKKYVQDNYETMCWCPTIGCQYVFCFENGESAFVCPICSKFYCLKCRSEYHIGLSCREFSRSKDIPQDDEKFYQFAEGARYKQCPKCKFWVEKSEGCHHMVCRCKFQFCYTCGEEYPNCGCNTEEQAERTELALQIAAEQLRLIAQGLQEHQRELERLQRLEQIQGQREFRSPFIEMPLFEPRNELGIEIEIENDIEIEIENDIESEQRERQKEPSPSIRNEKLPQLTLEPETLSSYRKLESGKTQKNILSTSVGSSDKQTKSKTQFQFKKQQPPTTNTHKTFHRSPQPRKIFKSNQVQQQTHTPRYPLIHKYQRTQEQKSQPSLSKRMEPRLQRPIYFQFTSSQKLAFTDLGERKKSYTKY